MFKIGTVCMKIAGRDAGKKCIIIEEPKDGKALIEGATRRRPCNLKHLEAIGEATVKTGADHATVMKALGLEPRKSQARTPAPRPRKQRKVKEKKPKVKKAPKKPKEEKPTEKKAAKATPAAKKTTPVKPSEKKSTAPKEKK